LDWCSYRFADFFGGWKLQVPKIFPKCLEIRKSADLLWLESFFKSLKQASNIKMKHQTQCADPNLGFLLLQIANDMLKRSGVPSSSESLLLRTRQDRLMAKVAISFNKTRATALRTQESR